jgi:nicotinate-nucleotide adenylyltransferase
LRELGVFCGTFNPIHLGHLLIAECARDQFGLEKVIFITSPRPPHRNDQLLDGEARHLLVSAAVADNFHFQSSRMELERHGKSYTADTVRALLKEYACDQWRINLILGADNIAYLSTWHEVDYLLKTCRFLVAPRLVATSQEVPSTRPIKSSLDKNGVTGRTTGTAEEHPDSSILATVSQVDLLENLSLPNASIETITFPCVSISSSAIRLRLSEGRSVLYMVPPAVNELLLTRNFYTPKHK